MSLLVFGSKISFTNKLPSLDIDRQGDRYIVTLDNAWDNAVEIAIPTDVMFNAVRELAAEFNHCLKPNDA